MQASITVDLEHDCPPFLKTYRGVTDGTPLLLNLLRDEDVRATFFTTGDVARRFPQVVRTIVNEGHELGCHGDTHARFSQLTAAAAQQEIDRASETLRDFDRVTSFRAPNLDFPPAYLPLLRAAGYSLDSSQGRHKPSTLFARPRKVDGLRRVPASTPPSLIRLPRPLRRACLRHLRPPVVLFFHPWEFIDLTRAPLRYDCRFRTGQPALDALRDAIRFLRSRGATFRPMRELDLDWLGTGGRAPGREQSILA